MFIFSVSDEPMLSGALWSRCQVFQVRAAELRVLVRRLKGLPCRGQCVHEQDGQDLSGGGTAEF